MVPSKVSNNTFNDTFFNSQDNSNATLRSVYVSAPKSYAISGMIMVGAIVGVIVIVVLMACFHMFSRWYSHRVRRQRRRQRRRLGRRRRASNIVFRVDHIPATVRTGKNRRLEVSVRNSLPNFVYSKVTHKEDLDCAVCLSEFEEDETGRVLPNCHHSFHTECIDMWFHSHSTCPVCRAKVGPFDPTRNKDVLKTVSKPVQSVELAPVQPSSSTCSEASFTDRRSGLDLGCVKIEVPSEIESIDELMPSSPVSYGFTSLENPSQSLKNMTSTNQKLVDVSPSTEIGTSCLSNTELDIELGIFEQKVREQV